MYSIDNTYDVESLRKWAARTFETVDPKLAKLGDESAANESEVEGLKGRRDKASVQSRKTLQQNELRKKREAL